LSKSRKALNKGFTPKGLKCADGDCNTVARVSALPRLFCAIKSKRAEEGAENGKSHKGRALHSRQQDGEEHKLLSCAMRQMRAHKLAVKRVFESKGYLPELFRWQSDAQCKRVWARPALQAICDHLAESEEHEEVYRRDNVRRMGD
jgi:hypothetical protein